MANENIFEQASRIKLRFATSSAKGSGVVSVEDLWDLPLKSEAGRPNLYDIATALNKQVQSVGDVPAFLQDEAKPADTQAALALDIIKRVIEVRKAEALERSQAADKAAQKQKILALINEKDDESLKTKSKEELMLELAKL
jgi:hypothetical protein